MGGGGHHVGIGHGEGCSPRGHQAGNVGHIHEEIGAYLVGNLPESLKINDPGIGGGAGNDHLGLALFGQVADLVIVDAVGFGVHAIGDNLVVDPRIVHGAAVGQVAAVVQVHSHDGVSHVAQGLVHCVVGRSAAVGLDVCMVRAEEGLGPVPGNVLHHVHTFTATIVALAGIALGILIGEHGRSSRQNGRADKVLRGNQLNISPLTVVLRLHGVAHLGILLDQEIDDIFDHDTRSFLHSNFYDGGFAFSSLLYSKPKKNPMTILPLCAILFIRKTTHREKGIGSFYEKFQGYSRHCPGTQRLVSRWHLFPAIPKGL